MFTVKVMKDNEWWEADFRELQKVAAGARLGRVTRPENYGFTIQGTMNTYIVDLPSAASKYRLAKFAIGFEQPDERMRYANRIGEKYFEEYSAQLLVMLAFVALETWLRVRQRSWYNADINRSGLAFAPLASKLRSEIGSDGLNFLAKAMDSKDLQERVRDFAAKDDARLLHVLSAIRNAFAHGKLGVQSAISLDTAHDIRDLLLGLVMEDCRRISECLRDQKVTGLIV